MDNQVEIHQGKLVTSLKSVAIICLIIGVIVSELAFYVSGLVIFVLIIASKLYLKVVHQPLNINVEWDKARIYPDGQTKLLIKIENKGWFSIYLGKFSFRLDKKMALNSEPKFEGEVYHHYDHSFYIRAGEQLTLEYEGTGRQRLRASDEIVEFAP